jgi:hypothetical protein
MQLGKLLTFITSVPGSGADYRVKVPNGEGQQ